jgi:Xaa-Pro aminopeptidase/Xaa-Pro dipeptidase
MPASDYVLLSKYLPADKMVPNRELYLAARMVKSESEIAVLRRIATISDSAQAAAWNAIAPGMSEKELSAFVTNEVLSSGGDSLRLLIGGGERSGLVNPRPSDRRIVSGDVLRLEVLANLDNYQSNVTRTGIIGRAEASHEKIWSTLIEARRAALDLLAPGRPVRDLWTAYERGCRHGDVMPTLQFLGHGIGLSGHEEPYITADSELVLEPGVVLTFEPFVMFPDLMGFHIEDMFLVTPSGYEILTTATDNGRLIEVASA